MKRLIDEKDNFMLDDNRFIIIYIMYIMLGM